jgi:hypothetical protein
MVIRISNLQVRLLLASLAAWSAATCRASDDPPQGWSFQYQQSQPLAQAEPGLRGQQMKLGPLTGEIYVYATFDALPTNPVAYAGNAPTAKQKSPSGATFIMPESYPPPPKEKTPGEPRGRQFLTLGQRTGETFQPAVRFGVHDGRSLPHDPGVMYTYLSDGRLEYYGLWVRPNTPYDFKLKLNLATQRMTAWASGRGDDRWYLVAYEVPLMKPVTAINELRSVLYSGAPGVNQVVVSNKPWSSGEEVRPHPLAKANPVVAAGAGFRLQSMRSVWGIPGKFTVICRKPGQHFGFPDVARSRSGALLCTFANQSHTGMQGGSSVCISRDGGRTWAEPAPCPGGGRVQILSSGLSVVEGDKAWHASADDGKTWTKCFDFDPVQLQSNGPSGAPGPLSHIAELPDGSWIMAGSSYAGKDPWKGTVGEQLEFFRSGDKGKRWAFTSKLQLFPPHSICEPSILLLSDGRLAAYAREDRGDGFPAVKAFSSDGGKTWQAEELPFPATGRICAKFLRDGRVMCTSRSCVGRSALWAWVGDIHDKTPFLACGVHLNDARSVALKDGALHIDNDGVRGQFTRYFLRQLDSPKTKIDIEAVVKVVSNSGKAATLSVPFLGSLRIFPDRVELAQQPTVRVDVAPGVFHTYRVVRDGGVAALYVDGQFKLKTDKGDGSIRTDLPWTPAKVSKHPLAFGNEPNGHSWSSPTSTMPYHLPADATGYSLWRSVKAALDDPVSGKFVCSWSADRDGFPDQYQLDHIIEVDATAAGFDQGYSGWVEFDDGRILVVNYTDDGAASVKGGAFGIPWIRGTWLEPGDLPAR